MRRETRETGKTFWQGRLKKEFSSERTVSVMCRLALMRRYGMAAKVTERLTGRWRPQANFGDERLRLVAGSHIGVIWRPSPSRLNPISRDKPVRPSTRHGSPSMSIAATSLNCASPTRRPILSYSTGCCRACRGWRYATDCGRATTVATSPMIMLTARYEESERAPR